MEAATKDCGGRTIPYMWDIFGKTTNSEDNGTLVDQHFSNKLKLSDSSSLYTNNNGNDSAISVGSTSEEDVCSGINGGMKQKKRQQRISRKETNAATAEAEVKYLERHLSMKKTIRKKIMRDLQKAFVEDPNEFRVEDIPPEQLKAEINLQSLSFAPNGKKKGKKNNESNFLDFLRTGSDSGKCSSAGAGNNAAISVSQHHLHHHHQNHQQHHYRSRSSKEHTDDNDSGHSSPSRANEYSPASDEPDEEQRKTSFWKRFSIKGNWAKR